jgi:hypothetical protein
MKTIDRKFQILAVNPVNGKIYTEKNAILLCAKDSAVPAALKAYRESASRLGANGAHLNSVDLLIQRVDEFQRTIESRVPDTVGEEIPRCIDGVGVDE